MSVSTISAESKAVAARAIAESLIGVLRMSGEAGTSSIFQVQYHVGGEVQTSPYGVYHSDDQDSLVLFTGQLDQETFSVSKSAIAGIRLVRTREVVRDLNALGPWTCMLRVGVATTAYLLESYRQWNSVLSGFGGRGHPSAGRGC